MPERIKWTERRFNFDFPAALYPEMIERLRGTPARLEDLLAGLSPEILTSQADERWSMQENAGHLLDLESLVSQRIDEYLASKTALHAADMSNRRTYEASYNEVPVTKILKDFRTARHGIVHRLESLEAGVFERAALHPRLNVQMRLVDMLFFQAEHDDYHLARISELKKLLVKE
jgi:DinB superfamily